MLSMLLYFITISITHHIFIKLYLFMENLVNLQTLRKLKIVGVVYSRLGSNTNTVTVIFTSTAFSYLTTGCHPCKTKSVESIIVSSRDVKLAKYINQ